MRSIPECTLPLAILMAHTPGRSGIRRPILTSWDESSTSVWTTRRSCRMGSFWLRHRTVLLAAGVPCQVAGRLGGYLVVIKIPFGFAHGGRSPPRGAPFLCLYLVSDA